MSLLRVLEGILHLGATFVGVIRLAHAIGIDERARSR